MPTTSTTTALASRQDTDHGAPAYPGYVHATYSDGDESYDMSIPAAWGPSEISDDLEEWASDGEWGDGSEPVRLPLEATDADGDHLASVTVVIPADEPACEDGAEHDWHADIDVVGGLESNPGVYGSGGGVVTTEHCARCGALRVSDGWHQDARTGQVWDIDHVSYREPSEASLAFVERFAAEIAALDEEVAQAECDRLDEYAAEDEQIAAGVPDDLLEG